MAKAGAAKKAKPKGNILVYDILHQKGVSNEVKEAELVGSDLESNQNTNDPLNSGGAAGGFQIQLGAHPGVTEADAMDPKFAVNFVKGMYKAGVAKVPPGLFKTNPELAYEEAAYYAERPKYTYYQSQGSARVTHAYETALGEVVHGADTGLGVPPPSKTTVAAPIKVTAAAKSAADRLYAAGYRGHDLVEALSLIGQETGGTFRASAVQPLIGDKKAGEALKDVPGEASGAWEHYVADAQANLKAAGHQTTFAFTSSDPGFAGTGGPSEVEKGADGVPDPIAGVAEALDSLPKVLDWVTAPTHLVQIALVLVGLIFIVVGAAKIANVSPPSLIPIPV